MTDERRPDGRDPGPPALTGVDADAATATAAQAQADARAAVDAVSDEPGSASYERLSDYLDAGRQPYDPLLEEHPGNRAQLAALERLRAVTGDVLAAEAAAEPAPEPSWIAGIMDRVRLEARSGREIPLASPDPRSELRITEGAVRALVREAGDGVPGAIVLSCTLGGDVTVPQALVTVEVAVSVRYGATADTVADGVRTAVHAALVAQTELVVTALDVLVRDVHVEPVASDDPAPSDDPAIDDEPTGGAR